jgi:hypothetical protein
MTLGNETHDRAVGHPSWSSPGRSVLLGFVVQVVGALVIWVLVDDRSGRSWSNRDFQEWVTLSLALAVLLAALGGILTRRLQTGLAVLMCCLLATAFGCAAFIGYAVLNSA